MDHVITLTTEELVMLLSTANYQDEARVLFNSYSEPKSANELEAIFKTTVNQLRLKGLWDEEKHKLDLNPITDDMMDFIEIYVKCNYLLRATNEPKKAALIFHHVENDTWLYHYVDDQIIHEFAFMKYNEIPNTLREFYLFNFTDNESEYTFNLTDEQFDILSNPKKFKKVEKSFRGNALEKLSFEKFSIDLRENNNGMENISVFSLDEERELYLENLVFFFQSINGVWLSEYEHGKEIPVNIYLANSNKWEEVLEAIQIFVGKLVNDDVTNQI
ncbi:hypothetical protein [Fictibacillus phosphorivorans]|uniref:hypothetical protein n=1 Tax=Fictibacillus phosphorivorans TaxID=1221500 RepID=UPI001293F1B8|nr:hypothetical protein [Fictibacillus phosphorivorans]MQR97180.1 hypothetical protein [Fictibacillus phosphorivorans]